MKEKVTKKGPNAGNIRQVVIRPQGGHHLFLPTDPPGSKCPVCEWSLVPKKAEKVIMVPLGPHVRNTLRHPLGARSLEYQFKRFVPPKRDGKYRWITDSYDARVYRNFNKRHHIRRGFEWRAMAYKLTADPLVVTNTKMSLTPVVLTNMSMHPRVRRMKGAMPIIMMFGRKFSNFQLAYR
jgi:hypothetical protein